MNKIDLYTYNTFDSIGQGYSSKVYKGKHSQTNESVAVKLIDMKFIKGEVHRKLLQSEISVLKALRNEPNIIQLYDVYNTKSNTCIVTELCDEDLSKVIRKRKTFPQQQALDVLKQIVNGYKAIYQNEIIHRDLKPANIFYTSSSQNRQIKIADFGFAIRTMDLRKRQTYNVGSPVYMPYEALNDNVYSYKSDIWAIGVIFYEMLTGKTPWRAKTEADLKRQLKATPIKNILPSNIGKVSVDFLLKALCLDVEKRMTADEMCYYFERISSTKGLDLGIQPRERICSTMTAQQQQQKMFRTHSTSTKDRDGKSRNQMIQPHSQQQIEMTQNNNISGGVNRRLSNNRTFHKKINMLRGDANKDKGGIADEKYSYDSKYLRTRANTKDNVDENDNDSGFNEIDPKKVSNLLVSQLHLCRFMFKLIQRIEKNDFCDDGKELRYRLSKVIFEKLSGIRNLTLLDNATATEFRFYTEFNKLYKIVEQYTEKYTGVLKEYQKIKSSGCCGGVIGGGSGGLTNDQIISSEIRSLYSYAISNCENPEEARSEVILLDYLITLKQLLVLDSKVGLEDFYRNSKIEGIVEGKPTDRITKDHIVAINSKVKAMRIF